MQLYQPTITGSLLVSGSIVATGGITVSGSIDSASYAATASFVSNAQSASYVLNAQTASFVTTAQTASFVTTSQTASFVTTAQTASYVLNAQSASNAVTAQTASYANAFTVGGTLTAQTLVVQTITSSVDFVTGSTRFGSLLTNTHVFSGSVTMNPGGLFVSSSGLVGIGTTSPSYILDVTGTGRFTSTVQMGNGSQVMGGGTLKLGIASGNAGAALQLLGWAGSYNNWQIDTAYINSSFNITPSTAAGGSTFTTPAFTIASGGNVGIGTTNPGYTLDVYGTVKFGSNANNGDAIFKSNSVPLQIQGRATYDRPFMYLSWDISPDSGVLIADTLRFNTGASLPTNTGTERIRITNGGNVGMGTTSPNLSAGSAGSTILTISGTTSGRNGIIELNGTRVNSTDISSYIRFFNNAGATPLADIRAIRGSSDTVGDLAFTTSNVERFRIADSGVKFQNGSSYLNYYEEGTFTPTSLSTSFNSVTATYGRYVRIGNQISIQVRWAVQPGGTGRYYIVFNLPFAFLNDSTISYTGAVSNYNSGISAYSSNVGTSVRNSSGSTTQQYVEAVFTSNTNTDILFSMTYFTF